MKKKLDIYIAGGMTMKKVEVLVRMRLEKKIVVEVEDVEEAERKAGEMIDEMDREEYKEFLSSSRMPYGGPFVEKVSLEAKVKMAIDGFDPYVLCPGVDAPYDEYDGESSRIAEKIEHDMSKKEIADIIAKEFTRSFNTEFTIEECMWPAEKIYNYLKNQV